MSETLKRRCSCCRKARVWDDTVTVGRRRAGSYNRAGSSCDTTVCRTCTIEQVACVRANTYRDGKVFGYYLDGEIKWSEAADAFDVEWSDLAKNAYTPAKNPAVK